MNPRFDSVLPLASRRLQAAAEALARLLRRRATALPCLFACALLLLPGCATFHLPPRHTSLESARTVLPATLVSNFLVIETPVDKHTSYHFIVDTGSSVTLVTPDVAKHFGGRPPASQTTMRVRGANGEVKVLNPVVLKRLQLGGARFEGVQALTHDLSDFSNHLGVQIDGVLGFPLFRQTLLTLDYLHSQIIITPYGVPTAQPGVTIPFNNEQNTPLIPIQLGSESLVALVDSGSDAPLSLNTVGLHPTFRYGPKPGVLIATLSGDRLGMTGRLAQPLTIGAYEPTCESKPNARPKVVILGSGPNRILHISAAITGKAKSAPSYGRLLARIARPAPITAASRQSRRRSTRGRAPSTSAPPAAATAPP